MKLIFYLTGKDNNKQRSTLKSFERPRHHVPQMAAPLPVRLQRVAVLHPHHREPGLLLERERRLRQRLRSDRLVHAVKHLPARAAAEPNPGLLLPPGLLPGNVDLLPEELVVDVELVLVADVNQHVPPLLRATVLLCFGRHFFPEKLLLLSLPVK